MYSLPPCPAPCRPLLDLSSPSWQVAAAAGNTKLVSLLLKQGAHVDAQASKVVNMTPLHFACINGQAGAAQLLLAAGANLEQVTSASTMTAFDIAEGKPAPAGREKGKAATATLLRSHGALRAREIAERDEFVATARQTAAGRGAKAGGAAAAERRYEKYKQAVAASIPGGQKVHSPRARLHRRAAPAPRSLSTRYIPCPPGADRRDPALPAEVAARRDAAQGLRVVRSQWRHQGRTLTIRFQLVVERVPAVS